MLAAAGQQQFIKSVAAEQWTILSTSEHMPVVNRLPVTLLSRHSHEEGVEEAPGGAQACCLQAGPQLPGCWHVTCISRLHKIVASR